MFYLYFDLCYYAWIVFLHLIYFEHLLWFFQDVRGFLYVFGN